MHVRNLGGMVLLLGVLAAACANAPTSGGPGDGPGDGSSDGISYVPDASQVVLRIELGGGFVPIEWNLTNLPLFSLFGDGLLVTPGPQIQIYPGPALPALTQRRLTPDAIQRLLQAAIDAGLDANRDYTDLGSVGIADAPTTTFTLTVDGQTYTTRAYALSELGAKPDEMSAEEYQAREDLLAFQAEATDLSWLPAGSVSDEGSYRPEALRVFVASYRPDQTLTEPPMAWPLDPGLASFGEAVRNGPEDMRCGVVSGSEAQTLLAQAEKANQLTPWTSEGARFGLLFRPLLPDESGC